MLTSTCYRIVDLVRETARDHQFSPPLVQVRADGEMALASLLGLGSTGRSGHGPHVRAGILLSLVFALALALALLGVDAVI